MMPMLSSSVPNGIQVESPGSALMVAASAGLMSVHSVLLKAPIEPRNCLSNARSSWADVEMRLVGLSQVAGRARALTPRARRTRLVEDSIVQIECCRYCVPRNCMLVL